MLPMGSNMPPVILMMVAALVCTVILPASGVVVVLPLSVFAQQEEDPSLGEEEAVRGEEVA
jgi:hypothetical protein